MTEKQKTNYIWFVYPKNSHTNGVLANELPEENLHRDVLCHDNVVRTMWQCPSRLLDYFWQSEEDLGIDFQIFNVAGSIRDIAGRVRECTFLYAKKRFFRIRKSRKAPKQKAK